MSGPRRRRWRLALRLAFVLAVAAGVAFALADQWHDVATRLSRLSAPYAVGAFGCFAAGLWFSMLAWRAVLADLGSPLPAGAAARVFFVGQLGKYLPGSVWPAVAQAEMGADLGVPRSRSVAAYLIATGVSVVTGAVVGVMALPALLSGTGGVYAWALLAAPAGVLMLHPRVLNPLLRKAFSLLRRPPLEEPLTGRGMLTAGALYVVTWLAFGGQAALLAGDIGSLHVHESPLAIGGYALAVVVGLLVVPLPAGAGVREAVLVVVLRTVMPTPAATAVAVVSRVVVTLCDLALAAGAALAVRRSRRPAGGSQDATPTAQPGGTTTRRLP